MFVCCIFQGMRPPRPSNFITNHIYLTHNNDYDRNVEKLCERATLHNKRVMLITSRKYPLPRELDGRQTAAKGRISVCRLIDIEATPQQLLDLHDGYQPSHGLPDLIVFDLHSIIAEVLQRPVMQQCSTDKLVRHIAKCSAAFANYREMVCNEWLGAGEGGKSVTENGSNGVDTIVVMSQESYPMTPAQFKLLIGLYFCGNECYTSFSKLSAQISISQGLTA
ncbi:uncharacterized protein LOC108164860 isoform X1 [Drosophila miranda]|uniref:uncharacterized protein LOC108164860 isoform X1 n=2 Tax=Drosophila miranda TaxID=7229 RepID=UPI0007E7942D|nr:uncharacterized protein LOC108164860 isoform X1 [Drosophila miranda]